MRNAPKIAILMLTHNAPGYVVKSIWALRRVTSSAVGYELIVVDSGNSDEKREVRSQTARYTVFGDGKCNR